MHRVLPLLAGLVMAPPAFFGPLAVVGGGVEAQEGPGIEQARAALMSAVVPGAGQYALGQRRAWAYFAIEAVGWAVWVDRRTAASDFRSRYKAFVWDEARLRGGPRVDGDFEYFERMSQWERSGSFDADAGAPGVQPEMDAATYNGSIWALAVQLFLPGGGAVPETDPQYQRALEYYRARAYGTELLWDWTGTGTAREEYAGLIRSSDDRFRQATNALGFVLANRLVSVFDAFVSSRTRGVTLRSAVLPTPNAGASWSAHVEIRTPW